jgi:hypothetical protein
VSGSALLPLTRPNLRKKLISTLDYPVPVPEGAVQPPVRLRPSETRKAMSADAAAQHGTNMASTRGAKLGATSNTSSSRAGSAKLAGIPAEEAHRHPKLLRKRIIWNPVRPKPA